ncbi:putative membrane protein [Gibbsiella quercinecans]|uniref:DNA gyrase subunit B n=1 Tax=Gibbsiella quercinecans TaxID=929813 RepID=A0A250AWX7_9GAMM|nr:hypothetical protein [Gibbsiella quercinecans]ATA18414.1 DNA gyrase subunit B [Gibbsiella quercinecans]RLM13134.1 DNA gyrase subunit B [Gibbsiella quercinecans]RLM14379.1 DNA gyrase subunit B [Gibbsiella quercinecans]TCT91012.1 putative membrane protein [Gibbsiella quercinecans]
MQRVQGFLRAAGWVGLLAWPPLIWLSLSYAQYRWLLPLLGLLFALRFFSLWQQNGTLPGTAKWLAAVGVGLCSASLLLGNYHLLLWYPVAVNVVMLALFGASLWSAMPLVERLARLRENTLPPAAVAYTRWVTRVWCVFFIVNGSVAAATCLAGNLLWWTWWNGMISYLLMGLLMAGEWLIRRRLRAAACNRC